MDKGTKSFLESKGFKQHPKDKDKMILEFSPRGGIIVFGFDENCFEFIFNYVSREVGDPELTFSGLSRFDVHEQFDRFHDMAFEFFSLLEKKQF